MGDKDLEVPEKPSLEKPSQDSVPEKPALDSVSKKPSFRDRILEKPIEEVPSRPFLKKKFDPNSEEGKEVSKYIRSLLTSTTTTEPPEPEIYGFIVSGIPDDGYGRDPVSDFIMFCKLELKLDMPRHQIKEAIRCGDYRPRLLRVSLESLEALQQVGVNMYRLKWQNKYKFWKYDCVKILEEEDDKQQKNKILPFLRSMYPQLGQPGESKKN